MTRKRIFITGASGCIGHYIVDALIQATTHELFLFVRNPDRLKFDYNARPGINLLQGDLRDIEQFGDLLQTMDCAILIATSWGGVEESQEINVTKTQTLVNLLDPDRCQQIIYFSTASILDRQNNLLKEASELGTEYIRSKYFGHRALMETSFADRVTILYPTLVFGGNDQFPRSHLTGGLGEVAKWMKLVRFFQADASFHFIHAQDIAQIVQHLVDHPPQPGESRQLVLGNERLTLNQLISQLCDYFHQRIYFRIPLYLWLMNFFVVVFRIQVGDWERFSINYRHFTHQRVVNPSNFGLTPYYPKLADVLRICGVPAGTT
ncbi:NAD(P)-dependent oxidoreductase [filamentous cyanobacterium LEGE 11480]|uniref:NAD(P)-dependent oxidoreductase n=1 Tax=Romeriopsis navalis LEGE 11480 TaxID=2777977 RepID=A0A928Z5R6_9CYAN|nr:NAD(P)-dependent oxidoreductase [Romeriopsis navalis]MBE9031773.1 NAD(P)-dependent oxidoreductase [Romeriopsis navalis LEGE 11480]